jgi:hypothetical protein
MTATGGPPQFPGWKPSAYQGAVVLSGLSAVLGLGREVLVYHRLGLSNANDSLQLALSITYTVALLGDPLRLAALNLLQRRIGSRLWLVIGIGIVAAALIVTLLYHSSIGTLPRSWLLTAGAAGAANLFLAWVLPRLQRSGPFLPVHAVTVMPNIFMVAGLLLPAGSDAEFASRVIGLFLLAPVLQLAALAVLRRFGDHPILAPPPTVADGLRPMAWHGVGAVGGQAGQFFLRTALAAAPTGTLTAFNLVLRATDTLRAIFVDTYIASRVRRWASGERTTSSLVDGRWLTPAVLALVAGAALVLAVFWAGAGRWLSPASAMLLIGAYLVLALRVRYQSLNTSAQPIQLVRRMAGVEVAGAAVVGMLGAIPGAPIAMLPWTLYVAKPAVGLRLVASEVSSAVEIAPES